MLIALHKGKGFIGRVIKWQTRSVYSHASLVFDELGGAVVESREFKGVRWLAALEPSKDVDLFRVELKREQYLAIRNFAFGQLGKPYDYTMVLRFISRRQASRAQSGKWFCSELVFAAFKEAGINLLERVEPWAVSPGLLALSPLLTPVPRKAVAG
jgi:uncharacterized protein YycO